MTTPQFDTSGHFHVMPGHPLHRFMGVNRLEWPDLSPFVQGYVEAMLTADATLNTAVTIKIGEARQFLLGFSDLAPETLARIMEDCERLQAMHAWKCYAEIHPWGDPGLFDPERAGMAFWHSRNEHTQAAYGFGGGSWPRPYGQRLMEAAETFPPLTVYLGDDGKVYLREAAR